MRIQYIEPHLAERIDAAKRLADKVRSGTDVQTEEDIEAVLRYVIAKHYNIPYFDKYFDARTLDELFFEAALITPKERLQSAEAISETVKEHEQEVNQLVDEFSDWIATDLPKDDIDVSHLAPQQSEDDEDEDDDDPFNEIAKQFMTTGDFVSQEEKEQDNVGE